MGTSGVHGRAVGRAGACVVAAVTLLSGCGSDGPWTPARTAATLPDIEAGVTVSGRVLRTIGSYVFELEGGDGAAPLVIVTSAPSAAVPGARVTARGQRRPFSAVMATATDADPQLLRELEDRECLVAVFLEVER